jgi:hypothetical protein
MSKRALFKGMMEAAEERWGGGEVERVEDVIRGLTEAIAKVEEFSLEPEDEPSQTLRGLS